MKCDAKECHLEEVVDKLNTKQKDLAYEVHRLNQSVEIHVQRSIDRHEILSKTLTDFALSLKEYIYKEEVGKEARAERNRQYVKEELAPIIESLNRLHSRSRVVTAMFTTLLALISSSTIYHLVRDNLQ